MTVSTVLLPEDIEKGGNELCSHLHPHEKTFDSLERFLGFSSDLFLM